MGSVLERLPTSRRGAAVKIDVRVTNVAEECVLACKTKEETLLPGYYGAQLRLDTESITRWLSEPLQTAHYIPKRVIQETEIKR